MQCPKVVLFDLDDTLAQSFRAPEPAMVGKIARLAHTIPIAIVTGASFGRTKEEILDPVILLERKATLYAFPDSASMGYLHTNNVWERVYSEEFTLEQLGHIEETVEECARKSAIMLGSKYDPKLLLEKTQVRYAALGLNASEEEKTSWDPDQQKRRELKALLDERLPECEVRIGGRTTIDITKKGVDKSYGVQWLSEHLKIASSDMLYVGDALYDGGNDQVVIKTGVQTRQTSGPQETLLIIDEILTVCNAQ